MGIIPEEKVQELAKLARSAVLSCDILGEAGYSVYRFAQENIKTSSDDAYVRLQELLTEFFGEIGNCRVAICNVETSIHSMLSSPMTIAPLTPTTEQRRKNQMPYMIVPEPLNTEEENVSVDEE